MRAGLVWLIAAICGLAAFGATLVSRAPPIPRPPRGLGGGIRSTGSGLGFLPGPIETLAESARNEPNDLRVHYHLARRYAWVDRPSESVSTWREVARLADAVVRS